MKNYKMFLCFFFVLAISFALLSGCGNKPDATGEDIDEKGYWNGIKATKYVELFNYKAMPIPNNIHNISDEALQNEIDNMVAAHPSETKITDQAVKDGDTVNIDYVGSVDGVEFAGGSTGGKGTNVTAGSTDYIDDFLTQIIGHMPGETINVEVTFPEDYGKEELNGKDAVFVTTINYISVAVESELTDDFVMSNFYADKGWRTVKAMRDGLRSDLQKSAIQEYIWKYFTTEVTIKSVPDQMIKYQENNMIKSCQREADMYGIDLNELLSYYGFASTDELIEKYQYNNLENAKYYLVIQAVAEDMNLSVSEEDLADYFLKNTGSSDYSSYTEQYGLPYLKHVVLNEKVMSYIVDNAVLG